MAQIVKTLPSVWETWVWSLRQEDPLVMGLATHSSTLALRIPWIEESGWLQFMGLQRVRHDLRTNTLTIDHYFSVSVQLVSHVRLYAPHRVQHTRLSCPTPTPRVYSNSCPSSSWCHLILCCPLLLPLIFPSNRVFSSESVLCIRWPKVLEFQLQHQSFQWIFKTDFL